MRCRWTFAILVTATVTAACSDPHETPVSATVCSIVAAPASFNGKVVHVRASIQSDGMHSSRLTDASCRGMSIPITWEAADRSERLRALIDTLFSKAEHPGTLDKEITASFTGVFRWRKSEQPSRSIVLLDVSDVTVEPRPDSPFKDVESSPLR
jgi:hypothetical protein